MGQKLTLRTVRSQRHLDVMAPLPVFLSLLGYGRHRAHGLNGIVARSRLTAQHERIGAVVDGIGYIGHLRTGGTRIVYHGVQHLRSHNHGLLLEIGRAHV